MNDRDRQSQNLEAIYDVLIRLLQVHFPNVFLVLKYRIEVLVQRSKKEVNRAILGGGGHKPGEQSCLIRSTACFLIIFGNSTDSIPRIVILYVAAS